MAATKRRAILSVTDKTGVVEFAQGLHECGFELLSTGGTAKTLREAGVEVTEVADFTDSPEILGGRVKTLHPRLLGGILARSHLPSDQQELAEHRMHAIELVCVNLYQFEQAAAAYEAAEPATLTAESVAAVIEKIDIGGPTMVRAAAKNARCVTIVVDPSDYSRVVEAWKSGDGPDLRLRTELAAKAFRRIAEYDRAVDAFFQGALVSPTAAGALPVEAAELLDGRLNPGLEAHTLRYGENPHQQGLFVRGADPGEAGVLHAEKLGGKELSYNNLLDAEAALELVKEFDRPAAVVIKHTNPCGAAQADDLLMAFEGAYSGDPLAAFGGILAVNRPLDQRVAERIATRDHFFEVLVAPAVDAAALTVLKTGAPWGKNLRILACGATSRVAADRPRYQVRTMVGGVLAQERDLETEVPLTQASQRAASAAESEDLQVAWKIVKHVRSNAIVLVKGGVLVGTGAGQMSRVRSVELAIGQAGERAAGSVMGSDAFFPFRDGIDCAAQAGVKAVIQPGGSRRDQEVRQAVDEADMAMVFTGQRHFRH